MSELDIIKEAVFSFEPEKLAEATKECLERGHTPQEIMDSLTAALKVVGEQFENGDLFLLHLVTAGEAAKKVISEDLEPLLKKTGAERKRAGRVVIGTVAGDIHDIGKNIVSSMLFASGFDVIDLGKDVPVEAFVRAVKEHNPDILGMSALLSTSLPAQREVIEGLKRENLRGKVKVILGGAPVTAEWTKQIGADGYAEDAIEAAKVALRLMGND
jgi:corrinoid protein of di/trimethylamine methyltransferase